MIKRTLVFASPGTLRLRDCQLVWTDRAGEETTVPLEDIGFVLLESPLATCSVALLQALADANAAVAVCDARHIPSAYLLPIADHSLAERHLLDQIACSEARANRLWRQIVQSKIRNQAHVAKALSQKTSVKLAALAGRVKNGDPENVEGQAAHLYFPIFRERWPAFDARHSDAMPNPALDYGYALLRAAVARALVSSGLHPSLGLHHHNQYNPFCLADDLMEPFRPFVDRLIILHADEFPPKNSDEPPKLSPAEKRLLLPLLVMDVHIGQVVRPLMNATSQASASLVRALRGEQDALDLPSFS